MRSLPHGSKIIGFEGCGTIAGLVMVKMRHIRFRSRVVGVFRVWMVVVVGAFRETPLLRGFGNESRL